MVIPNPLAEPVMTRVRARIDPLLASRHIELVELTYRREGPQMVLRFLIDTAAGITVAECGELNRAIGAILDEHDVIPDRYTLEVASPGLDRSLKTPRDFERVIGRRVAIHLREPLDGRWELVGTVASVGDELVTITLDSTERMRVPLAAMASARQEISFER